METMCLLLALKLEHPHNVHLIRGNHEAADINALFGFRSAQCMAVTLTVALVHVTHAAQHAGSGILSA